MISPTFEIRVIFQKLRFIFHITLFQKQPPEVFYKKAVLKNFAIFTGKHMCWNLFLIKLQAIRLTSLLKRDSNIRYFPVNIVKFLRAPIFENVRERLLLYYS